MTILLLSNKWDISIDYIVKILRERNYPYLRINTEDLINSTSTVRFPNFSYLLSSEKINLKMKLQSVLLRRPEKPFVFTNVKPHSPAIIKYITDQWHSFIFGLESIPDVLWVNNPHKNSFAEMKINQLNCAEKMGFTIPKTCVTNSKDDLLEFFKSTNGQIIAKALYAPLIQDDKNEFFIFSNKISNVSDIDKTELSLSPVIFQEALQDKIDYRVTVVGSTCFVAEITYDDTSILDWRMVKNNIRMRSCTLPSDIINNCIQYVSELGLQFGAIDLIKSNDKYYFLEINPNGEWGWLQKRLEFPIAESITEQLVAGLNHG